MFSFHSPVCHWDRSSPSTLSPPRPPSQPPEQWLIPLVPSHNLRAAARAPSGTGRIMLRAVPRNSLRRNLDTFFFFFSSFNISVQGTAVLHMLLRRRGKHKNLKAHHTSTFKFHDEFLPYPNHAVAVSVNFLRSPKTVSFFLEPGIDSALDEVESSSKHGASAFSR